MPAFFVPAHTTQNHQHPHPPTAFLIGIGLAIFGERLTEVLKTPCLRTKVTMEIWSEAETLPVISFLSIQRSTKVSENGYLMVTIERKAVVTNLTTLVGKASCKTDWHGTVSTVEDVAITVNFRIFSINAVVVLSNYKVEVVSLRSTKAGSVSAKRSVFGDAVTSFVQRNVV